MDNSFQAAMNDLVAADAARMSGRAFADARGTGVARRVRTRRTVRAAGMGGASAVAVGAIAFGATHMPWGALDAAPGIGGTDCATPSPSDDAYAYEVIVRQGVTPVDTVSLTDAATGATFLTATLQPDGTYVFTDADGNALRATAGESSGSYWILGPQVPPNDWGTASPGAAEIGVKSVSTADFVGLPSAVRSALDDCYTPSPTPTQVSTVAADPSPSPDPSVAAKPEDVVVGTNPFQCGFAFPVDSSAADGLWTLEAEQNSVADVNARLADYSSTAPQALGTAPLFTVTMVDHFAATLGSISTVDQQAIDPALVANRAQASGVSLVQNATFVAVVNGSVVGTIVDPYASLTPPALFEEGLDTVFDNAITLLNPDIAFTACPGITLGNDWTPYVVVGDAALDSAGKAYGPVYGWVKLGGN